MRKYFSFLLLSLALIIVQPVAFGADEQGSGVIDDSIRDMSIVLGSGAVGAVLGLSTLSFVDTPSKHWKNVAVGGSIGIVIGVGIVIFTQATRSTSSMATMGRVDAPLNAEKFASLSRQDFTSLKIAKDFLKEPSIGYTFTF
ncbi:MAG: hypothetical protein ACXVLQ_13040 [Bacteriovorax sp.]